MSVTRHRSDPRVAHLVAVDAVGRACGACSEACAEESWRYGCEDTGEIAEDNHADLAGVKVERQAKRAVFEGQQLIGHATRQSRHVRNAVASSRDVTDLLGRRIRRLVRLDEIIERLAYRGGINGKFCHDHSLLLFLNSVKSCFRLVHRAANRVRRLPSPCAEDAAVVRPPCCR